MILNEKNTVKFFFLIPAIIFFAFNARILIAQGEINASAPSTVRVNNAFNYTVSGEIQGQVSVKPPPGIRIVSGPSQMVSYQSSNVNGKLTTVMQVNYTFVMIAEKKGDYVIPPATLSTGDESYKTGSVNVKAVAGASPSGEGSGSAGSTRSTEPDPVIMQLIPSKTELFEGEQLVISTKIYVRARNEMHSLSSPDFEGFWVENLDPDQRAGNDVIEGYNYNSQVVRRNLLTAQRKGEITIEPASLDVTVLKRIQRRRSALDNFFDDPFFDDPFGNYERERKIVKSNTLTINIKPLPGGAPESFKGAVGQFDVSAMLRSDSVQTNNALSLVININGKGNLNLINPPKVDFPPDLEIFEPKRTENVNHSSSGTVGSVSFEYVIIPRHNGNYRISPVNFSYFHRGKGQYETFNSSDFRFAAYGGEDEGSAISGQSGLFREDVRNLDTDIRFIKTGPASLRPVSSFLILNPFIYAIYGGGLLLVLFALFFWRKKLERKADIFYIRNKKARKIARRRLKAAYHLLQNNDDIFYEEILKAIWGYLADRLGINTADLSRERLTVEMNEKGIDDKLQSDVWSVIEESEYSRYSPESSGKMNELYEKAIACMQKIEQKI